MQEIYRVKTSPVALSDNMIIGEKYRITFLTEALVRLEYSEDGVFEDRATQTVLFRDFPKTGYHVVRNADGIEVHTSMLHLIYNEKEFSSHGLSIQIKGNLSAYHSIWHYGEKVHDLQGTARTLDDVNGEVELGHGVVSRFGYSILDDSKSQILLDDGWIEPRKKGVSDLYFFGYGHDYKQALNDFYRLCGKTPMLPRYALGNWWSRYYKYSEESYMELMNKFDEKNIPFTVAVIDMDWHQVDVDPKYGSGWTGYTWNKKFFPDPKRFLGKLHDRGMHTTLNVHPADGVQGCEEMYVDMAKEMGVDYENEDPVVCDPASPKFMEAYFKYLHHPREAEGVDFWWIDWQQHLTSNDTYGLSETFWCNHIFFNDMVRKRTDRRPVIFHRWGGLGSHRYQIGFSGDALINFQTLGFQPYFTATASNVGYGYWGHDLGGHAFTDESIVNDPELVLRWIQFGVFTPIFRTHATNDARIERRIWKFDNFPTMLEAVRLRYSLFPYLYTMARKAYDTGISVCRPLYYEYPESEEAYVYENEYFFGDDILVVPITEAAVDGISAKEIWFPEGKWWSVSTNELIEGPCKKVMNFTHEQIPYFFRQGAIIPYNPPTVMNVTERPDNLILNIVAGSDGESSLYEDSGNNSDYATMYSTTALKQIADGNRGKYIISARRGNYKGGASVRSYTLRIFDTAAPVSVKVNGNTAVSYVYDKDKRCTTVEVPAIKCSTGVKVEVIYSKE